MALSNYGHRSPTMDDLDEMVSIFGGMDFDFEPARIETYTDHASYKTKVAITFIAELPPPYMLRNGGVTYTDPGSMAKIAGEVLKERLKNGRR